MDDLFERPGTSGDMDDWQPLPSSRGSGSRTAPSGPGVFAPRGRNKPQSREKPIRPHMAGESIMTSQQQWRFVEEDVALMYPQRRTRQEDPRLTKSMQGTLSLGVELAEAALSRGDFWSFCERVESVVHAGGPPRPPAAAGRSRLAGARGLVPPLKLPDDGLSSPRGTRGARGAPASDFSFSRHVDGHHHLPASVVLDLTDQSLNLAKGSLTGGLPGAPLGLAATGGHEGSLSTLADWARTGTGLSSGHFGTHSFRLPGHGPQSSLVPRPGTVGATGSASNGLTSAARKRMAALDMPLGATAPPEMLRGAAVAQTERYAPRSYRGGPGGRPFSRGSDRGSDPPTPLGDVTAAGAINTRRAMQLAMTRTGLGAGSFGGAGGDRRGFSAPTPTASDPAFLASLVRPTGTSRSGPLGLPRPLRTPFSQLRRASLAAAHAAIPMSEMEKEVKKAEDELNEMGIGSDAEEGDGGGIDGGASAWDVAAPSPDAASSLAGGNLSPNVDGDRRAGQPADRPGGAGPGRSGAPARPPSPIFYWKPSNRVRLATAVPPDLLREGSQLWDGRPFSRPSTVPGELATAADAAAAAVAAMAVPGAAAGDLAWKLKDAEQERPMWVSSPNRRSYSAKVPIGPAAAAMTWGPGAGHFGGPPQPESRRLQPHERRFEYGAWYMPTRQWSTMAGRRSSEDQPAAAE